MYNHIYVQRRGWIRLQNKKYMSACFTGYRPEKFPFDLSVRNKKYIDFENLLVREIYSAYAAGCRTFYTGMAMGFDIIAAEAVIDFKNIRPDVKLICAVPFKNQSKMYTDDWDRRYDNILKASDGIVYVSQLYEKGCYFKRNKYMVDNSDIVITWFDGRCGGTANTVRYAHKIGRTVINLCNLSVKPRFFPKNIKLICKSGDNAKSQN